VNTRLPRHNTKEKCSFVDPVVAMMMKKVGMQGILLDTYKKGDGIVICSIVEVLQIHIIYFTSSSGEVELNDK
jgi:hypothetical protein